MAEPFEGDPRTNRERMLAGDLYLADDPELERRMRHAGRLAHEFGELATGDPDAARAVLATLLGSLGEGTVVRAPLYVDYGENLHIGPRTFVNYGLVALDVARIEIGADCQLGPNVQLLTAWHPTVPEPRRAKLEAASPIRVADNVWLGGGAIVLPGMSIGENSVVGAGAVVTNDVPANVVAVGNPARVIRELQTDPPPARVSAMSATPADFNDQVIAEFRANDGVVGGIFEGMPLLLLHNAGAKSGKEYVTPLVYLADGDRYVIFASKGGAPENPGWYHNLKAGPDVSLEVGTEKMDATAEEATGAERDRLYSTQEEAAPQFSEYAEKTDRKIPVVVLTPKS